MEYRQGKLQTKEAALVSGGGGSVLENIGSPELGLVVDQSGSMGGLGRQLIESFNALLAEQKSEVASARVSLALFNNGVHTVHDGDPVADIPLLSSEVYRPEGGTALNDAIGSMIQGIGKRAKRGTRVLIAILTDGDEIRPALSRSTISCG